MKELKESLLSGFDNIAEHSDQSIYLNKLLKLSNRKSLIVGYDVFGRRLEVGDIVIFPWVNQCRTGIILDINKNKEILISRDGDIEKFKTLDGSIPSNSYLHDTWSVIKINTKILKQIYLDIK